MGGRELPHEIMAARRKKFPRVVRNTSVSQRRIRLLSLSSQGPVREWKEESPNPQRSLSGDSALEDQTSTKQ
jgi:hypothetical protein